MRQQITVGAEVGYAKKFLKSINAGPTDPFWTYRGTVMSVRHLGDCCLALVRWHHGQTMQVNAVNLARPGTLAYCE
jgi:hypothetical protein